MRMHLSILALCAILVTTGAIPAQAWHITGLVICEESGQPLEGVEVVVRSTDGGTPFTGNSITDVNGEYNVWLPEGPRCYEARVMLGVDETAVNPPGGAFAFCTTPSNTGFFQSFSISSPVCGGGGEEEGRCWLTGGGNRYVSVTGTEMGEVGNKHNWGGNVYPSCSSVPGDGGNWNHIAHVQKLHFQGKSITVVRCGNVDGIPPGSTSPETPFNFIEFEGSGSLRGIKGNTANHPLVYFFARAEDRNEPGSSGVDDGARKDRYFLHVFSNPANPAGSTLLLVDGDRNAATVDPLAILHGNLQLHASSCDAAASTDLGVRRKAPTGGEAALAAPAAPRLVWLASPRPNPAGTASRLRFGLPVASPVSATVHDLAGRLVRRLASGTMSPGEHELTWDLADDAGAPVARGLYYVRIATGGRAWSKPVVVMR